MVRFSVDFIHLEMGKKRDLCSIWKGMFLAGMSVCPVERTKVGRSHMQCIPKNEGRNEKWLAFNWFSFFYAFEIYWFLYSAVYNPLIFEFV